MDIITKHNKPNFNQTEPNDPNLNHPNIVRPKLVERRDLMPAIRSFSELELNANSASKLRLICMAECEPICSIDWYLNRQLFSASTTTSDKGFTLQEVVPLLLGSNQASAAAATMNQTQTVLSRSSLHELPLESGSSMMVSVENLIYRLNPSGKFTWRRESSFSGSQKRAVDSVESSKGDDYSDISRLMREADLHLSNGNANVFSKFELTYNQIVQLLQDRNSGEVLLECKLNDMFLGATSSSSSSSSNGNLKHHQLGFAFVEPQHWFPSERSTTSSSLYQFAMSNDQQPLNLTNLFASYQDSNQSSGQQTSDADNDLTKHWTDLEAGRIYPPLSSSTANSPSNNQQSSLLANGLQIRILLDSEYLILLLFC